MSAQRSPTSEPVRSARVLLLEGEKPQARKIMKVLRAAVDEVHAIESLEHADPAAQWDLLIANYDVLSADGRQQLFRRFEDLKQRGRLLLYSSAHDREELVVLFGTHGLTNLLAKNPEVDGEELLVTMQKMLRRDIFGLEKYFPWGVHSKQFELACSLQKDEVIHDARAFARGSGVHERITDMFCTVADELVTNAMYNAPVDGEGNPRFAHWSRTQAVTLAPHERVEVRVCSDGRKLGLSVADPFGSLTVQKILDYLSKCFRRGNDQVDSKDGGAGLGLYTIFEALSNFVINVKRGDRTEMIGIIDIRGSYRDLADRSKSFNIFVTE